MNFRDKSSIDISDSTHPLTDDSLPAVDYLSADITNKYFVLFLSKNDTLAGISLYYHVEISKLKKANKITHERHLHSRKYILIPKQANNIHLEKSLGTVIYPDINTEPKLDGIPELPKVEPLKRSTSVEPRIENHGWQTIDTTPQYSDSTHSESYLQKIESAVLQWYISPSEPAGQRPRSQTTSGIRTSN